jgi:murein DD-endopeptidase MepM/ murein hydrolase activator NlpD
MKSLGSLERGLTLASARLGHIVSTHPRGLTGAVMLALGGFGATAFGIAPLAPDAAHLPQRLIVEELPAHDVRAQIDMLAEQAMSLYRSEQTRSGDTADSLLKRLGVNDSQASEFLRKDPLARATLEGRAGKLVRARSDSSGELAEMTVRYAATGELANSHFTRLTVARSQGRLKSRVETVAMKARQSLGGGVIQSSLFAATDEARIPDGIAIQVAEIFAADIDFHRQLRKGDRFSVIYETLSADGEPITWGSSSGHVLAAEFVNKGQAHTALWFKQDGEKGAYYTFDGKSRNLTYLTSPLEFSRTTSGFAMRMHPILKEWRQHKGVDFAAARGTPVRTVGNGVVEFAGRQNGYGNVVEIKHRNEQSTLYAHLNRIDVKVNQAVSQGEVIGAVGATGWATGPHLHFEYKLAGVQQNPDDMPRGSEGGAIAQAQLPQFAALANSVRAPLAVAETVSQATSYSE